MQRYPWAGGVHCISNLNIKKHILQRNKQRKHNTSRRRLKSADCATTAAAAARQQRGRPAAAAPQTKAGAAAAVAVAGPRRPAQTREVADKKIDRSSTSTGRRSRRPAGGGDGELRGALDHHRGSRIAILKRERRTGPERCDPLVAAADIGHVARAAAVERSLLGVVRVPSPEPGAAVSRQSHCPWLPLTAAPLATAAAATGRHSGANENDIYNRKERERERYGWTKGRNMEGDGRKVGAGSEGEIAPVEKRVDEAGVVNLT
ncbi:hypothetical protein EVAR_45964_1 [Eumeta japonica]|uniref:Uncharacterized protein n=1 Tax=Eumeta variegata TaxID=151549 RepID=A0A4C1YLJ7_EUMVA|nr:hypothetical protein EVAR_45964_1 [Eumeta japonica]